MLKCGFCYITMGRDNPSVFVVLSHSKLILGYIQRFSLYSESRRFDRKTSDRKLTTQWSNKANFYAVSRGGDKSFLLLARVRYFYTYITHVTIMRSDFLWEMPWCFSTPFVRNNVAIIDVRRNMLNDNIFICMTIYYLSLTRVFPQCCCWSRLFFTFQRIRFYDVITYYMEEPMCWEFFFENQNL